MSKLINVCEKTFSILKLNDDIKHYGKLLNLLLDLINEVSIKIIF